MNDKIYNLIMKILDSDLLREDKTEIVRFFLLPRNTVIKPSLEKEIEKHEEELGTLGPARRPDHHTLDRKADPEMAAEEDATRELLKDKIKE